MTRTSSPSGAVSTSVRAMRAGPRVDATVKHPLGQRIANRLRANTLAARRSALALATRTPPLPYFGTVGVANLGDELLLRIAESSFPGRVLIPVDARRAFQRTLLTLSCSGAGSLLVGGGTSVLSDPLLLTLQRSVQRGLRFSTFGSGVADERFFGELPAHVLNAWTEVFRFSDDVGVRGPHSVAILRELGVQNARVVGDPAVVFVKSVAPTPRGGKVIGVNVGTAFGAVWAAPKPRRSTRLPRRSYHSAAVAGPCGSSASGRLTRPLRCV